jgi:hypothetical protein
MSDAHSVVFEKENVLIGSGIYSVTLLPRHGGLWQVN